VRRIRPPAAAVLGALAVLALPAAASAAPPSNLVCNGTSSGTYASVTVPPNGNCNLFNATVLGSVVVLNGGNLNLANADDVSNVTIKGSVVIGSNGNYSQYFSDSVGGPITAQGASGVAIAGGTTHDIVSNASQDLYVYGDTAVKGSVTANQTQDFGEIAVSYGPTSGITGNVINNGDPGTSRGFLIEGQEIGGSVFVTNNQSSTQIFLNTIDQNLVCTGNSAPLGYAGYGNYVLGHQLGQCAGFPNDPSFSAQDG
jgi:hypothetical protein